MTDGVIDGVADGVIDGVTDGVVDGVVSVLACADGGVDVSSDVAIESSSSLSSASSSSLEASGEAGGLSKTMGGGTSSNHHAWPTHSMTTWLAQSTDPVMKKNSYSNENRVIGTPERMTGADNKWGEREKNINDQK